MAKENVARVAMDEHAHLGKFKCQGLILNLSNFLGGG
jgi:hypothetical protein